MSGRSDVRRHHHRQRSRRRDAGRPSRAVRQADPHPRARRLAAARDRELGRRRGLRQEPLRLEGHLVRRQGQGASSPGSTTTSAARPSSTARRSTGSGARTSASCGTTTASRRRGRSRTTTSSRTTRRRSSCTRSTATTARIRPSRRRARPTRSRRCPTSRGSSSCPTTSSGPGYHPFHAPCGVRLHEGEHALQPVHPVRDLRRLPVARPGQVRCRDLRRPAGPRASERHAR